jgi:Na+-driven multidrug efflux pump
MAFSGGLRGAGDTMSPLWATLVGTLVIGPGLAWLLALRLGMGPAGVWIGMLASMLAQAIYTGVVFRAGRWKKIEL